MLVILSVFFSKFVFLIQFFLAKFGSFVCFIIINLGFNGNASRVGEITINNSNNYYNNIQKISPSIFLSIYVPQLGTGFLSE